MVPLKIGIIIGSTRPNRFSEKPAQWIFDEAKKRSELDPELLDLRDYPMPFYNEPASPMYLSPDKYSDEVAKRWAAKIEEKDGYIWVAPEYNHGTSAVLKNALDYVYHAWTRKPVGFVSWGSVGGGRAVEHLRLVAVELQMAPLREGVHIPGDKYVWGGVEWKPEADKALTGSTKTMLDQLIWWGNALKAARK